MGFSDSLSTTEDPQQYPSRPGARSLGLDTVFVQHNACFLAQPVCVVPVPSSWNDSL